MKHLQGNITLLKYLNKKTHLSYSKEEKRKID